MTKSTKITLFSLFLFTIIILSVQFVPGISSVAFAEEGREEQSFLLDPRYELVYSGEPQVVPVYLRGVSGDFCWRKKIGSNFVTVSTLTDLTVQDVGDSGTYDLIVTMNGTVYHSEPFDVVVNPYVIDVDIKDSLWNYYKTADSTDNSKLTYEIITPLPFHGEIPNIELSREEGVDAGTYKITGVCKNPNYSARFNNGIFEIKPVPVLVTYDLSKEKTIYRGEKFTLPYTFNMGGFSSDASEEEIGLSISYYEYDNGVLGSKKYDAIPHAGRFLVKALTSNPNYYAPQQLDIDVVIIPAEVVTESGIKLEVSKGFSDKIKYSVTEETNLSDLKKEFETSFGTQEIYKSFKISISGSEDVKVKVSVPVQSENKHYTLAIRKADGSITYTDCKVEDGYAVVEVAIEDTSFFLWQDKDNTVFAILALLLLLIIIVELIILIPLGKEHSALKRSVYGFAIFGTNGIFAKLGIYTCIAICGVEILVAIGLLAAITILKIKINRKRRS